MTPPAASPSPRLAEFIAASPFDRKAIFAFMSRAAASLSPGARVLDAGAGDAPYRELFAHCDYRTSDWSSSVHAGGRSADVVASLDALPLPDAQLDAVLNTQVLEHVADPQAVLHELARILAPGGELWLTVPLVNELHEEPHDYFRYTPYGLTTLFERAGLEVVSIEPLTGFYTTLAMLLRHAGLITGVRERGDVPRRLLAATLRGAATLLPRLDRLDERHALPLGYGCRARRPAAA
ncbi:MAG: class I SAM-dependent methyltransferase [Conexibacter sp.]